MQLAITLSIYRHYYPEFTVSHYIIHYVNCIFAIQNNHTPLHFASKNGHCSIVEYLITSGADINAVDIVSCIFISILIMIMFTIQEQATPLLYAALKGRELVVQHLIKCGADVNSIAKVAKLLCILFCSLTRNNKHMHNLLFVLSFMHLI